MPNDPETPSPSGSSDAALAALDFERAEGVAQGAAVCAQCQTAIASRYFTLGPHVLCERCQLGFRDANAPGNPASRFLGAAALGSAAAAIGCALWMLVTQLTGYEIGLIAIVVGYLVGMAVRTGARRLGGLPYQLLAIFLTYSAIVMTYVPMIAAEFSSRRHEQPIAGEPGQPGAAAPEHEMEAAAESFASDATAAPGGAPAEDPAPPVKRPGADRLAAWIAAIPLAYALPFLAGFENAIGILIIGFALWQAARMNARSKIALQGPFRLEARDGALG